MSGDSLTPETCVRLNDKGPNATPGQASGQHYVQGDWLETADESKKSCIVKILARYSDLPDSSYSISMDLTELEKQLSEKDSILKVDWKSVELLRLETVILRRQNAYVTLSDGQSLADTITDSGNPIDDGLAASLGALTIHQDYQVPASAALLKAQEVFENVFPGELVPTSVTACKKGLHRVWINLHDYEAAVRDGTPVYGFSNKTLFLRDLESDCQRIYSKKRAKKLGLNGLLKTVF